MEIIYKYFPDFNDKQLSQLQALEGLYRDWNEKINVISRKDIDSLNERHVLHSLAIAAFVPFTPSDQVLDIGTGGGFPGIPLAIYFPKVQFTLVDSSAKKLKVVESVAGAIGLTNIRTLHSRVENIPVQRFHYVVSRSVAPLKDLMEWSKPLLRIRHAKITVKKAGPTPGIYFAPGLICLNDRNPEREVKESNLRFPFVYPLDSIFKEPYFKEKFFFYVSRQSYEN